MADKTGYIGRNPADSSVVVAQQIFNPTGTQTDFTFSAGYTVGYLDVYLNGIRLITSTDYNATDGSNVTLVSAAGNGDVIEMLAYKAFNLATDKVGILSESASMGTVKNLNFIGAGNTFLLNGDTMDITIEGVAGGRTYDLISSTSGSNVILTLDASTGDDDPILITAGSNITLTEDGSGTGFTIAAAGGGSGITVQDEGSALSTLATTLDFVGSGVVASGTGATKTITVSGGTDTTYDLISSTSGSNIVLTLDASSGDDDPITITAGSNITLTEDGSGTGFTIAASGGGGGAASQITVADESSDTTCFPVFTTAATGDLGPKTGSNLTFDSSTGNLGATLLTGTLQTAAQANITSVGTLGALSVSGDVDVADKIIHTGDADTAIRFPAADTFTIETGGSERFRIDATGHFGLNVGTGNGYTAQLNDTAGSATLQLTNATIGSATGDGSRITASTSGVLFIENQEASDIRFWTNGSEKLRITSGGDVSIVADSKKLLIGAGDDLQLYHNGSDSYVQDAGTGSLILSGSRVIVKNAADNEKMIDATEDGAVELYHNNVKKIETKATGIQVVGSLTGFEDLQGYYTGSTVNYSVTVASKDATHRYNGTGSGSGYKIDGVFSPWLTLTPGRTYRFTLSNSDMTSHPFRFYLEADKTTAYTTNVTSTATYTEITVTDTTPSRLYYQCSAHAYMGNGVSTNSTDFTYVTGTWTPTAATGFTSPTYDTQIGHYTRFGNLLYVSGILRVNGGTATGSGLSIGGLPYDAASVHGHLGVSVSNAQNIASNQYMFMIPNSTTDNLDLYHQTTTNSSAKAGSDIGLNAYIRFAGTYMIS